MGGIAFEPKRLVRLLLKIFIPKLASVLDASIWIITIGIIAPLPACTCNILCASV